MHPGLDQVQPREAGLPGNEQDSGKGSQLITFHGTSRYFAAINKSRINNPAEPVDESNPQAASFLRNETALTVLTKLRQHSSRSAWEQLRTELDPSVNADARQNSWWQVGKAVVQSIAPASPRVFLGGPGFAPQRFAPSGEPENFEALEELKRLRKPCGPNVSHLPRPSDRLAFQQHNSGTQHGHTPLRADCNHVFLSHSEEHCAGQEAQLPPIRKTLADMFQASMVANVPPKVVYSGKVFSSIDSSGHPLSDAPRDGLPTTQHARTSARAMVAKMKLIQNAVLKNQPTALHLLVTQTRLHANGGGGREPTDVLAHACACDELCTSEMQTSKGCRCPEA